MANEGVSGVDCAALLTSRCRGVCIL